MADAAAPLVGLSVVVVSRSPSPNRSRSPCRSYFRGSTNRSQPSISRRGTGPGASRSCSPGELWRCARSCAGGTRHAVVLADRRTTVAPYGVRKIERLRVGLRVRGQRIQIADLARDVAAAVFIVIDAVQLSFVATALVLAVGRVGARGAAIPNLDAAGAERAVCAESGASDESRRWPTGASLAADIGKPSCAQPICGECPFAIVVPTGASASACASRHDGGKW